MCYVVIMAKTAPFSVRLSKQTDDLITREAKRTKRSKGAVLEGLAQEALNTRRFPGIAFRGSDWNRRPWLIGTALDVWEVVRAAREFESPGVMAANTDLTEHQVRLALAFRKENSDEIDDAIRDAERPLEDLRREFPGIDTIVAG